MTNPCIAHFRDGSTCGEEGKWFDPARGGLLCWTHETLRRTHPNLNYKDQVPKGTEVALINHKQPHDPFKAVVLDYEPNTQRIILDLIDATSADYDAPNMYADHPSRVNVHRSQIQMGWPSRWYNQQPEPVDPAPTGNLPEGTHIYLPNERDPSHPYRAIIVGYSPAAGHAVVDLVDCATEEYNGQNYHIDHDARLVVHHDEFRIGDPPTWFYPENPSAAGRGQKPPDYENQKSPHVADETKKD